MSTVDGVELGRALNKEMSDDQIRELCHDLLKGIKGLEAWMKKNRPHDGHNVYSIAQNGPITFPLAHSFHDAPVPLERWVDAMSEHYPQPSDELNDLQRRVLGELARGDIVFCHMDIQIRNVMIKDGRLSALLDWDHAGWYTRNMEAFGLVHIHAGMMPKTILFVESMLEGWNLLHSPIHGMALSDRSALRKGYAEVKREQQRASAASHRADSMTVEARRNGRKQMVGEQVGNSTAEVEQ